MTYRAQLAYFCCKSVNWFLYVPINVWDQFFSWNTTYFLTIFFVIFPHLNWPVDEIFFQKISVCHEYLEIYGGNSPGGINRGVIDRGELTRGKFDRRELAGVEFSRDYSPHPIENNSGGANYMRYYLLQGEIRDHNVMMDGWNFFDQPMKNNLRT